MLILKGWSLIVPLTEIRGGKRHASSGVALGLFLSRWRYTHLRAFDLCGAVPQSYSPLCLCLHNTHTHKLLDTRRLLEKHTQILFIAANLPFFCSVP